MSSWTFAGLLAVSVALVGGVIYLLLRYSAEEEARALKAWEDAVETHRRVTERQRGRIWAEDRRDAEGDDAA